MKSFTFEAWNDGRLTINGEFAELFRRHGWTTCETVWSATAAAEPAKALRSDRVTLRFALREADGTQRWFYIKRHGRSAWWEWIKPWFNGQKPLLGARHEWQALLSFHRAGLPTMTPVALGEFGEKSFLITEGLDGCEKLSHALDQGIDSEPERRELILQTADVARGMHDAGLHHQDFYLGHLMRSTAAESARSQRLYVIDLGRVQPHGRWTARRWIVKDLAQLNYSARTCRHSERMRFLRSYLNRPLQRRDLGLIRRILKKTARIARHAGG